MNDKRLPTCLAFLLCEAVTYDTTTSKHTLVGLLSDVRARAFPLTCPELVAYHELTGEQGSVSVALLLARLLDLPEAPAGRRSAVTLSAWRYPATVIRSPEVVVKIAITLRDLSFPEPGDYAFVLEVDGTPLMVRGFEARLLEHP